MVAGGTHQLEIDHFFTSRAWTKTTHVNIREMEIRRLIFSRVTIQKPWHLVAIPKQFSLCYDSLGRAVVLLPKEQKKGERNRMRKMYSGGGKIYCNG